MHDFVIPRPAFGFIVATRVAFGIGVGLLVANRLSRNQRRRVGAALAAFGAGTTIPAIALVVRSTRRLINA